MKFQGGDGSSGDAVPATETAKAADLTAVEDEDDRKAAKSIMAEVGGVDKEFEAVEEDDDILCDLTPIEQYALKFVQRENRARLARAQRDFEQKNAERQKRENDRKLRAKCAEKETGPPAAERKRSERIDTKQKIEKAKENEKKRQRRENRQSGEENNITQNSEDEEVYIPRKREKCNTPPKRLNGTRGRGRPRKEDQMKVKTIRRKSKNKG